METTMDAMRAATNLRDHFLKLGLDERATFLLVLAECGVPGDVGRAVLRDAATIQRAAVAECNGDAAAWQRKRSHAAATRLTARLTEYGITPRFQGDPRGACVKLALPTGRRNDFGGEGVWCVPTPNY